MFLILWFLNTNTLYASLIAPYSCQCTNLAIRYGLQAMNSSNVQLNQLRPSLRFRDSGISGGGGRGRRNATLTES